MLVTNIMPHPLGASSTAPTGEQRLRFDAASGEFRPYTRVARYVRTIPFEWLKRANRLPGSASAVATALWFLSGVKKSSTFRLTAEAVDLAGCSRKPLYRALAALEQAGLVGVQRRRGARPIITILRPDIPAGAGETPRPKG
ncbi:hypothetical protein [Acidocella sp.]|uniref:hypothetical protein n=1 Tax=Acidocella sp. TaxID=50710 RepID=UPI003D052D61